MSAFNAQFVAGSSFEFFTLWDVTLPGPIPCGMTYKSELRTAVYKGLRREASGDEIDWYRRTVSPDIDIDDREHTINVYIHTLCVFKPSHHLFKWVLELTDILNDHVPKYSFSVWVGDKTYGPIIRDHYYRSWQMQIGTTSTIIRHVIDLMYAYNILTTFNITTKSAEYCGPSYRSCYHDPMWIKTTSSPDTCFWCYLREQGELPYGVYLFDKQFFEQTYQGAPSAPFHCIECVIYDINHEVIDWFVNLERFVRLKRLHLTPVTEHRHWYSGAPRMTHYPLLNEHAYLTSERLSLLIKLMREDSHLLDRIYGTSSFSLISETIIDVPPSDKSSTETQTEPPKGLISKIFGL